MTVLHSAPRYASHEGYRDTLPAALGDMLVEAHEEHGELFLRVRREAIEDVLRRLRDEHDYQQLMEIAGIDYPSRPERFELVYMLLSLTRNHRVMVRLTTDEATPVPTVTTLWPNAGWLEREVFDMFGVLFNGNTDLRRILTDYGFEGHPFRKDFPLTGYTEVRYSEEEKRVIYEPVELAQDLRKFDFTSPWEGADYVLPGDEKAATNPVSPPVDEPKVTERASQTGAGARTDAKAAEHVAPASGASTVAGQGTAEPVPVETGIDKPGAPDPTEDRPARAPREESARDTKGATEIDKPGQDEPSSNRPGEKRP